jgi:hypothetical protein
MSYCSSYTYRTWSDQSVHTFSRKLANSRKLIAMQAPSWVYYSFAFGMWMQVDPENPCEARANWPYRYSTMDNVDGKQARRTGTSSPLGELFEYVT